MVSDPKAPTPRGCTNLKLRQLTRLATRHYERFLAGTGLRITQFSLLAHVVRLGPLRAGELAASMRLSASALSRNLQPLAQQGLVEVAAGDDARSRMVAATLAGHARHHDAAAAWKQAQLALNRRLGADRVVALHALVDECTACLEADPETAGGDDEP